MAHGRRGLSRAANSAAQVNMKQVAVKVVRRPLLLLVHSVSYFAWLSSYEVVKYYNSGEDEDGNSIMWIFSVVLTFLYYCGCVHVL